MVHINIKPKVFDILNEMRQGESWSSYLEDKLIKDIGSVPTNKDFELVVNNKIEEMKVKVEQLNDELNDIKNKIGY